MRRLLLILLIPGVCCAISVPARAQVSVDDAEMQLQAAQKVTEHLPIAEWLGPMAPVALSPFFGIACLSGLAIYGGDWVPHNSLMDSPTLNDPLLFWVFVVLTLVTSLPRLTKVSKPVAQLLDQVETWAGIITMLVIRFLATGDAAADTGAGAAADAVVLQAGFLSFTVDTLLMLAMALNIFVINTVRFFFELLVWITPLPMLDAIFEVLNKSACAGLTALYAFSPTLATGLNILLFAMCFIAFRWIYRRVVFFRTMLFEMARHQFGFSGWKPDRVILVVFPQAAIGSIPARSLCRLSRTDEGWRLTSARLFRPALTHLVAKDSRVEIVPGFFTNCICFVGPTELKCTFGRRMNAHLPDLAAGLQASLRDEVAATRKVEFA